MNVLVGLIKYCLTVVVVRRPWTSTDISVFNVGTSKISYEGTLNDLYENNRKTFVKYNLNDVHIVVELDKKLDYIETSRGICHIGHVAYEDIYWRKMQRMLNLSSKEIAPLLNISPKSVEVKRYRLRKKINLPHESNLIDYILGI